ncbi:MAG: hypothetical protein IJ473_01095 [Alphaproteobacteria bacterium]|nr:hypothetical protein [Alphaproteobacteria bacterium]
MNKKITIFEDDAELIYNGWIFDDLKNSMNEPLDIGFNATKTTTNYNNIDVDTKSSLFNEPLQKLDLEVNDLRGFDRTKLPSAETRTKDIWGRESVLRKIIFANMLLGAITKDNPKELGGQLRLRIKDVYKPIEAQQALWNNILNREIANAGGDKEEGYRIAKILCSDPTNFDENNPKTAPIHTTGAAVDTFLWSDFGSDKSAITIAGYKDENGKSLVVDHYNTDFFEKKLANGEKLTEQEETCLRNRRLLNSVMKAAGFENYVKEPWHFDYKDQMYAMMKNTREKTNKYVAEYGYARHPER